MTRRLLGRGVLAVVGAATVAVLATGVVDPGGWSLTGAVAAQPPAVGEVDLGTLPSVLVCPPAPRLGGEVGADATDEDFQAASDVRARTVLRTEGGLAGQGATLPGDGSPSAVLDDTGAGDGSLVEADGSVPATLQADPATALAGLAVAVADDGDLAGLAASSCTYAVESGWLVGGGVEPGRSGRVVLSNPGTTTATVDLTVLTPSGPVQPPAAQALVVPPGAGVEVLLEGLVAPTPAVAVGVSARGGAVAAHLVDTRLAGVRSQGVEQVALGRPATSLTLPGVPAGPSTTATLRLANPGAAPAAVGWQVLGPDGALAPGEGGSVVTVPAGAVVEVPLPQVTRPADPDPGVLAVQVTSDRPVAAAVQARVEREDGLADSAVVQPAPLLAASALALLAGDDRVRTSLALVTTEQAATLQVVGLDAEGEPLDAAEEVVVQPGRTTVVEPPDDAVALLLQVVSGQAGAATVLRSEPEGGAYGALVSSVPVHLPPPAPGSVRVGPLSPDVLRAPVPAGD